jgi:CheY-specific phosphatase CheX
MNIAVLTQAAVRTFEELCFLEAEPVTDKSARGPTRSARVTFRGPQRGTLTVCMPERALAEAADNMLGPQSDGSPPVLDDVAREITNVVCGHVLPLMGDEAAVFEISAPAMIPSGAPGVPADHTAEVAIGGFVATVSLTLDPAGG